MLVYTFRTNPFKDKLKEIFPDIFIFDKLNEDFKIFSNKILKEKPDKILGIAKSDISQSETKTINQFNNKKIDKNGRENYNLTPWSNFDISKKPTTSFCNWTMYKIAKFIEDNNLNTKLSFVHLSKKDLDKLINFAPV
jgi:hypothetical protein